MADGYARVSGRLGRARRAPGAGLTNALTGITEAAKSRTPLVVLAADARPAPRSNFRIDVAALAAAVGAVPGRLHSAGVAVDDAVRAYRGRGAERRTRGAGLPLDVQAAECDRPDAGPRPAPPPAPRAGRAAGAVGRRWPPRCAAAQRPVFIAGRGARAAAGAGRAGARWPTRCGALLATSAAAKGLFPGEPVGPRRERRLRHAAGRRADRAAPTWSSAGAAR